MLKRFLATAFAVAASSVAMAQGTIAVDLLDAGETTGTIPANFVIADVFVDIATTDVWTAGGVRALTLNGATLNYFDEDPNTPGVQPGLFNGGTANKFYTSLSKPRARDGAARFTNAAAAAAGAYNPTGPNAIKLPGELNVAYFASPPESSTSPSADGYVARLSVNIAGVSVPAGATWGAGVLGTEPAGSTFVLRSEPPVGGTQTPGTVLATFDVPQIAGVSWGIWFVPEPTSLVLLALGGLAAFRRR
ncbi:MAG: PEP-CTERM sorting domain-containing protein [Planctomycetes bacterium]|nr:PEP-CTERM sorting domain-containing protein [Planctomycetota bacterium]